MTSIESVKFPSVTGEVLAGTVDIPDGGARAWAVFCHGFTLGKNSAAAARTSKALARRGIGVLRYDAVGLGGSTGDWSQTTFTTKVQDVQQAAGFMASSGRPATVLIGHSLGGTAVLGAAPALPEVKAVVTVSAPYQPIHVAHLFDEAMDDVERKGVGEVTLGGKRLQIRKQLIEDLERADLSGCIRELNRPLLVMHSPTDETVGIDNAGEIFQAAMHPKSFISLDRCDHLLTERWQAERIAGLVAAWVDGYLPAG